MEASKADSEVMPKMTTDSKAAPLHEVITTALDIVSTEAHHRYDENSSPIKFNIGPGESDDEDIHNVHGVTPINPPAEEKLSDIDDELAKPFEQMLNDEQFLATISDENEELYLKLNQAELDRETASNLLGWYRIWMNDQQIEDSHYGGGQYDFDDGQVANVGNGIGAKEGGQEVEAEVEQEGGTVNDGGEEKQVEVEGGGVHVCLVQLIFY